jgi:hypothetical protein
MRRQLEIFDSDIPRVNSRQLGAQRSDWLRFWIDRENGCGRGGEEARDTAMAAPNLQYAAPSEGREHVRERTSLVLLGIFVESHYLRPTRPTTNTAACLECFILRAFTSHVTRGVKGAVVIEQRDATGVQWTATTSGNRAIMALSYALQSRSRIRREVFAGLIHGGAHRLAVGIEPGQFVGQTANTFEPATE